MTKSGSNLEQQQSGRRMVWRPESTGGIHVVGQEAWPSSQRDPHNYLKYNICPDFSKKRNI